MTDTPTPASEIEARLRAYRQNDTPFALLLEAADHIAALEARRHEDSGKEKG